MVGKKRERIRGKHKRSEKIAELAEKLFDEQFDEDTVPVDIGDIVELLCLMADQIKELSEKEK